MPVLVVIVIIVNVKFGTAGLVLAMIRNRQMSLWTGFVHIVSRTVII